jgi:GDP-L-fucose synthase
MRIFLAGHNGMVGSAILRKLEQENHTIIKADRKDLDLRRQSDVEKFFEINRPEQVIIAAAKVGGINANNKYRADFIYSNLQIQTNIIHTSYLNGIEKLLFLGSSCIYPKSCSQPMKEEYLLKSPLEYTNEPYAIAKIAGIKMCESYYKQYKSNFISVMPTNLYGINDTYNLENSHVIPALIMKFHEAKEKNLPSVKVWGSGNPRREFMYVDDLADACLFVMRKVEAKDLYEQGISHLNIGTGIDLTIKKLAEIIKDTIGYKGEIDFETDKPDGHRRKLLNVTRLRNLGYTEKVNLYEGIKLTYQDYLKKIK